ncbi:uncharacterized protein [Procambarus clarkii]|uniref:uncharacterized protein isoform X2 n=1 Tax=Procambarus clarkii TaxID=6728 RepID=UPI00374269F4
MVCLPFKPAAGTNVPANIRIVDEAHTKMLWKVLATELQENTCRSTFSRMWFGKSRSPSVSWKSSSVKQNQVIMMHGLAWSEAPLLCKRKSTKVGDCLWSCLGLLDLLFI